MASLILVQVFRAEKLTQTYRFEQDIVKIGRLASAHLKLDDPKVARIHAVIECAASDNQIAIIDMGSTEGTFVNGARVQKAFLQSGDQIVVGETRLSLMIGEEAEQNLTAIHTAPTVPSIAIPAAVLTSAASSVPVDVPPLKTDKEPLSLASHSSDVSFLPESRSTEITPKQNPIKEDELPVEKVLEIRTYWGDECLDVTNYNKVPEILLGDTKKAHIFVSSEQLSAPVFPLIQYLDGVYTLALLPDFRLQVELPDERVLTREDLQNTGQIQAHPRIAHAQVLRMQEDCIYQVECCGLRLVLRFVTPAPKIIGPIFEIDYRFLNIFVIAAFFMLFSLVFLRLYPIEIAALDEDLFKNDNRFAHLLLDKPKAEAKLAIADYVKAQKRGGGGGGGKNDPGKAGESHSLQTTGKTAIKNTKGRPDDRNEVNKRLQKMFGGGHLNALLGSDNKAKDLLSAIGSSGQRAGSSAGQATGVETRGDGSGGYGRDSIPYGGTGTGTGTGGTGNGLHGALGIGDRGAYRPGSGGIGNGRGDRDPLINDVPFTAVGALDPSLIRKVINDNRAAIRYCYERQLQIQKSLSGKIRIQFLIQEDGLVKESKVLETTMNSQANQVESCIAAKIRTFIFPKPRGGGMVLVNYPFVFKSAGE